MIEIIVNNEKNIKTIAVLENGKLIECYEENEESLKARNEGNIYIGVVKDIIPGMQAAFVDIGTEKNSFIHVKDIVPQIDETKEAKKELKIKDVTKINQKILVQVQKDSNNKKGARTTTHIKITGKYVVLMPNTTIITASQKIESKEERERIIKIVRDNLPENMGAIVRTIAEKESEDKIIKDLQNLIHQWNIIKSKFEQVDVKAQLIYKSPSILEKMLLDINPSKIQKIELNNREEYDLLKEKTEQDGIKIEYKQEDLLNKYEIRKQIEKTKERKVWLNCGGFITIDSTEALVAIDVNSGKYTGKKNVEETIYKVNYEATIEIAKQLKLRDIGGIIIIDYIDMTKNENKEKIEMLLKEELKKDRAKTQVEGFTKLNLMEMTRKHICSHNS